MDQDVTLSTHTISALTETPENRVGNAIVELLIQRIGRDRFEMWFAGPNCVRQERKGSENSPATISVAAENMYALNRIKSTFGSELRTLVDLVCGSEVDICYRITRSKSKPTTYGQAGEAEKVCGEKTVSIQFELPLCDPDSAGETDRQPQSEGKRACGSVESGATPNSVSARPTKPAKRQRGLKSFWFGTENRLAEASVTQILEQPGQFTPFFVYGPTGSGKTHLLEAILNEFRYGLRQKRCVMLSAEQFTSLFVASLRGGEGLPVFRRKYRDLDLLVIDDIQFLVGKKATLGEFFHTVDILVRSGKQIVVSADRPAVELGLLGGDFGNRLNAGLSCPLRYAGTAGRIEIAKRLSTERNIQLSPQVLEFVGERLSGDIRRISGALNRLHAFQLSVKAPITIEIAENELGDLFTAHRSQGVSLMKIETAVCELCGIKPMELKSSSRQKSVSAARMLAMYLSRQYTSSAFSEIGDYFGGRSHSTVIAAQKKVNQWLERDISVTLPHATYRAKEVIHRLESNLRIG
jgi:chromosomal replication initiator protein